jgi:predicted Mrr-cat superfamily restriction endonuclease
MHQRAWGIKLGSGGICVPFCEKHGIVGVGWRDVDPSVLASPDRDALWQHVAERCGAFYGNDRRKIGGAVGQLFRFAHECKDGDLVIYYDPPRKHVRIGQITSGACFRDFELAEPTDIWHYRTVELSPKSIPILDFYGGLKGSLLGPRMSFWDLGDEHGIAAQLFRGEIPGHTPDPKLTQAYDALRDLLVKRAEALTAEDWEWLVVDYFKAQGAHVDERKVGKSQSIIDAEARFDHGELGAELWRIQVKHLRGQKVDWAAVEADYKHVGEARFCYVSVFGFTDDATKQADKENVRLLEAGDFARFLLSGKLRPRLRQVLRLPFGPES